MSHEDVARLLESNLPAEYSVELLDRLNGKPRRAPPRNGIGRRGRQKVILTATVTPGLRDDSRTAARARRRPPPHLRRRRTRLDAEISSQWRLDLLLYPRQGGRRPRPRALTRNGQRRRPRRPPVQTAPASRRSGPTFTRVARLSKRSCACETAAAGGAPDSDARPNLARQLHHDERREARKGESVERRCGRMKSTGARR